MNKYIHKVAKIFPFAVGAGVIGQAGYTCYRHIFFVERESIKNSYYGNITAPFDNSTQKAINKVFDRLVFEASGKQCALTRFYWSNKPTIQHLGTTLSRFGTYIGVPIHFKYENPSEVDLSQLESGLNLNEDNLKLLQRLRESLVLSEDAKKFAMASEFLKANSLEFLVRCNGLVMLVTANLILQYLFADVLKFGTPTQALLIFVVLAAALYMIHYSLTRTYYNFNCVSSERRVAKFGEDFLDGGIEYFEKMLEKNKVLRELDPQTAGYLFKPNGDEVQGLTNFGNIALSERLTCLQEIKKEKLEKENLTQDNSEDIK